MKQTPIHDQHNPDLLRIIPPNLHYITEVGCSSGALAREYKKTIRRATTLELKSHPITQRLQKNIATEPLSPTSTKQAKISLRALNRHNAGCSETP